MPEEITEQVAAHLPIAFVEDWKKFLEEVNTHDAGIAKITGRITLYNAMSFYMESKRKSWKKEA